MSDGRKKQSLAKRDTLFYFFLERETEGEQERDSGNRMGVEKGREKEQQRGCRMRRRESE